ncbi:MAG TPA: GH25 family lysozyme [Myxococcales bacterium]|jgi:MYXO-CTERM domain-containing protein
MRTLPSLLPSLVSAATLLAACGAPDRPGADLQYGELEQAATVCADGPTVEGIDISQWQGTIDWNQVRAAGKEFAIARIGDGLGSDPTFQGHWASIKNVGMIRGAYQFFRTGKDALAQADIVVAAVGRLGPGDLPVTCDVEDPNSNVSAGVYNSLIHQWADRVEQGTGKRPMIYTGKYYWDPKVASNDFAGYPLWHAQYTNAACPNINDRWGDWVFWQYRAEPYPPVPGGTCPGISGWVDLDHFNGTLDQLKAFAGIVLNQPPGGWLDAAACDSIRGWAQDPDAPAQAIDVHVYFDGPAGSATATGFPLNAGVDRADLCGPLGSCNHGYNFVTPLAFQDGKPHEVHVYGIDTAGGANAELSGSPQTLTCPLPALPVPPEGGVKRHFPDMQTLTNWKISWTDMVVLPDAQLDAYPLGPDVVAAPALRNQDGDPAVYLLENQTLRHVPDPQAMSLWRFDWGAIQKADLGPDLVGATLLGRPWVVKGSGAAIYLLDAPPPLWGEPISDDLPTTLQVGQTKSVTFKVKNRGSLTWKPGEIFLGTTGPRDHASALCDAASWSACHRAATVAEQTAPGAVGSFTFVVKAPAAAGTVKECLGMLFEAKAWFSAPGQMGPADDAMCKTVEVTAAPVVQPDAGTPVPGRDASVPSPDSGRVDSGTTPIPGTDAGPVQGKDGGGTPAQPGSDAGSPPSQDSTIESGCGCAAGSRTPFPGLLLTLGLLASLARRRRG